MTESKGPRLVERAIDVLMALMDGPQDFTTVCRRVELSKATVHRILTGLSYADFVLQDPVTSKYLLGPGAQRLAESAHAGNVSIALLARPRLVRLRDETRETVVLHMRMGAQRVCVEELTSTHELRFNAVVGSTVPVHVGAAGKVLLAWLPAESVSQLLDPQLKQITDATIADRDALMAELAVVKARGYAESVGERVQGLAALSAPVFDGAGAVIASLSLLGPEARLTEDKRRELSSVVTTAARDVSALVTANSKVISRS